MILFVIAMVAALPAAAAIPAAKARKGLSEAELKIYPEARGFPSNVQRFMVKRADCEHWIGEEGYDAPRKREIERAVRLTCTGVDRELDRLRKTYRRNPRVLAALKDYDKVNLR